jgi:hypothetical protein
LRDRLEVALHRLGAHLDGEHRAVNRRDVGRGDGLTRGKIP